MKIIGLTGGIGSGKTTVLNQIIKEYKGIVRIFLLLINMLFCIWICSIFEVWMRYIKSISIGLD